MWECFAHIQYVIYRDSNTAVRPAFSVHLLIIARTLCHAGQGIRILVGVKVKANI